MKSKTVTILSIVGVLVIATGAMAVNADTLSSIGPGTIGRATEVLVPVATDAPASAVPAPSDSSTPTSTPAVTPASSDDHDSESEHQESSDDD
ncbi:hypothetical protein JF66_17825 [Cryobacterium sp. MLB-32]|uniref:hypothetical protein n=1 Tax=Cryobacterium sp. MLB-32 TaxID=1529318 RepID=UPI0004E65E5A|nr:hypothetical protein [Cryobacterium sp. MLB-32]KFF58541.1 hypothetical protein JF66_17825 [Cryobacterium sp. MLB-32]